MSMNEPDRLRPRGFKVALYLSVAVSVVLQLRTGYNPAFFVAIPAGVFLAYLIPAIVRARRQRRASGAPRPRVIYPLSFKIAGVAVLIGFGVMYVLWFTQKGQAWGQEHTSLKNAIEGISILALIAVAQWQRSIIHGQLGADWIGQSGLASSDADSGRR